MIDSDVTWQAAANQPRYGGISCRWGRLAIMAVAAVTILYTILWLILAHILQNRALLEMRQTEARRGSFHCDDVRKTGYPLRVGVMCSNLNWQNEGQSMIASIASLVADAPVYAPSRRSIHLQAPAHLVIAHSMIQGGVSIDANWDIFDIQADFAKSMVTGIVLNTENLRLKQASDTGVDLPFSGAEFVRLDMGFEGGESLIKLMFDEVTLNLRLEDEGEPLPNLSGDIHIIMDMERDLLMLPKNEFETDGQGSVAHLLGQSGQVPRAVLRFTSGGRLEGQGSFNFSQTGLLSGNFTVAIDDMSGLQRSLRPLLPSQAGNLDTLFFALNTMPKNANGAPQIPIKIDEGKVRIGFLPVGKIPSILPIDAADNE